MYGSPYFEERDESDIPEKYADLPANPDQSNFTTDANLAFDLSAGLVPEEGTTIEVFHHGYTKAEALGKAYVTRDEIRDNGGDAKAEYIEPAYTRGGSVYHRIELTVTDGGSNQ